MGEGHCRKKEMCNVFGLNEEALPIRNVREQRERKVAEEIVEAVCEEQDGGRKISEEIEEVFRLGKYEENKSRPLKIRLRSQVAAQELDANEVSDYVLARQAVESKA